VAGVRIAHDARMNIEECLREIKGKAALIRYLASSAVSFPA